MKKYLQFGNTHYGVEHTTNNNEEFISLIVLKKRKQDLLVHSTTYCETTDSVANLIPKNSGLKLVVNTNKVLSKKTDFSDNNDTTIVHNAFPNINLNDFYYSIWNQKQSTFISICRKKYIDDIIDTYAKLNLSILDVSLGNHSLSSCINYFSKDNIYTSNALITLENSDVLKIDKTVSENTNYVYDINGLIISNNYLLSTSFILGGIINSTITNSNITYSNNFKELYCQKRFYNIFFKFGLGFIFTILLINFIFFNNYFDQAAGLKQTSLINQSNKEKLLALKVDVSKKEKFIKNILKSGTSKSSFYINEIMQSLPKSILINKFDFQPLKTRIKPEKPIVINSNIINLKGISVVPADISNWISRIERFDWLNNVVIEDYSESNNPITEFELLIKIR